MQLWVLFVIGLLCQVALGADVIVTTTLSDAIASAVDGDNIILTSGTNYNGTGNVNLALYSRTLAFITSDVETATIDCEHGNVSAFLVFPTTDLDLTTNVSFNGITFVNCLSAIYINTTAINDSCTVSVTKSAFLNNVNKNTGGGAIFVEGPTAVLLVESSSFSSNVGDLGGAILAQEYAIVSINNSVFENNNSTSSGGAVAVWYDATIVITYSTFTNNFAHEDGGAVDFYYLGDDSSHVSNSVFNGNRGNSLGGALSVWVGVVYVNSCQFNNNLAQWGGSLLSYTRGLAIIRGSQFTLNNAFSGGGAICSSDGYADLYDSIVSGNHANLGGGVAVFQTGIMNVYNSNITDNTAVQGGAIFVSDNSRFSVVYTNVTSNVASSGNGDSIYCEEDSSIFVNTSQVVLTSNNNTEQNGVYCDPFPEYTWCEFRVVNSGDWSEVCVQADPTPRKKGLKGWEVALIVVGVVLGALLIGFVVAYAISSRFEGPSFFKKLSPGETA